MTSEPEPAEEEDEKDDEEEVAEVDPEPQLRCMVNLTGDALSYPQERWANASLLTDISVFTNSTANPEQTLNAVIAEIQSVSPNALFGTYISGGRVEESFAQYPHEAIAAALIPGSWLIPQTDRVNLANRAAATTFADLIINDCEGRAGQLVFLDNIVHPSALEGWISWADSCWFMERIRSGLAPSGKRLIANLAVSAWGMTDTDVHLLSQSVDGMSFEMPFHALARGDTERTERLITTYRTWLDEEKIIVLIAVAPIEIRQQEAEFIAGFAMLFREPGDRLYVAWPFFQEAPGWTYWPRDWGPPEGEHLYEGGNITRVFKNVLLEVAPLAGTVSVQPRP